MRKSGIPSVAQKKFQDLRECAKIGIALAKAGRRNMWDGGEWYIDARAQFGVTAINRLVTGPGWTGYSHDTLKTYASIVRNFPPELRYLNADCSHYQTVAPLPKELAMPLLEQAIRERWTINRLRIEKKRVAGYRLPLVGGDVVDDVDTLIRDKKKFRAILVDPPWGSMYRTVGKRGASDPYYPLMSIEAICRLRVAEIATDDAFLFLWCPASFIQDEARDVILAWDFRFKTHGVWEKDAEFGTGYYFRMQHEDLLLGARPKTPKHFVDRAISSVIHAPRGEHSEKPPEVHHMIERALGGREPFLELFGRRHVPGWTVIGNQLAYATEDRQLAAD
jgi:N6-adenosine-specific RNA methylase IME4